MNKHYSMETKIAIRWARAEDRDTIARYIRALMVHIAAFDGKAEGEVRALDAVLSDLDRTMRLECNVKFVIAEVDGKPAGMCGVEMTYSTWHAKPYIVVNDVYVDESCRRYGIGTKLMEFVLEHAKSLGCCRVDLLVETANVGAQKLYEKVGFERCAQFHYSIRVEPSEGVP